jgi:DNA-binding transcriptional LysR family regulator
VNRSDATPDTGPTAAGTELDIRSLRYFIAVAEELHFSRAAARLFVAQQALSRDIRSLERRLGTPLFVRTTRRVTLTPEGERLLGRARELVALHDQALREIRAPTRPVIVDLVADERLTGVRILELARAIEPQGEFRGHYGRGMGAAISALLSGEIDVAIGRADWLGQEVPAQLERRLVRLEPLALLMPETHPLLAQSVVPLAALEGVEIDANPVGWMLVGGVAVETATHAPEWSDFVRQFLALTRARPTPPHAAALSLDEQSHHLIRQGVPMLVCSEHPPVPGGVARPLTDPVPLFPWSIVSRPGANGAAVAAIESAAARLAEEEGWLDMPASGWLPQPEASQLRS